MKRLLANLVSPAMKYCDFVTELTDDGSYRHACSRPECGQVYVTLAPRHRAICRVQCDVVPMPGQSERGSPALAEPPQHHRPSLLRRARTFTTAHGRWLAAGRPIRTSEQMDKIFSICETCESFRPGATKHEGTCRLCGCRLSRFSSLFNKAQMATEGCPAKPPKWNAEVDLSASGCP